MTATRCERFGIVPAAWFADPALGADEIAVLAALAVHADPQGLCWPSQAALARSLRRSRTWVIKVINRLEAAGALERTRRIAANGAMRTCLYRLVRRPRLDGARAQPAASSGAERAWGEAVVDVSEPERTRDDEAEAEAEPERARKGSGGLGQERRAGARVVDPAWLPSTTDVAWARERRPDIDPLMFTEFFIAACRANGYRYHDHAAAWRAWLLDRKRGLPHAQPRSPSGRPRRSWRDELAERNERAADACIRRFMERRARAAHPV
ncbi:helix-turn-helix domain-containing protein [Arenibaculum sp.]|jgi:DNA-binding Lrp family transcriptional regulator|uniref:helix-turn-helix domain-containing protein n=1 Tax=Arenibaculum sp. TaxID=2865862 RepID=UPI002E1531E4|nr:helix-turn-helix domain-containing protein [Arenibaculum sp.]